MNLSRLPLTADTQRPVGGYFWSEDSKYVLYVQDKGGDENYHIYSVDPMEPVESAMGVPPARDLTPYPNVRAQIYEVPERTLGHILVGLNDRDPQVYDVYRLELATDKRKLVQRNDKNIVEWITDLDGKLRLGVRIDDQGGTRCLKSSARGSSACITVRRKSRVEVLPGKCSSQAVAR